MARRTKVFVQTTRWDYRYNSSRRLYVPTPLVFSYCTGLYMSSRDDNGQVEVFARMENTSVTMARLNALC